MTRHHLRHRYAVVNLRLNHLLAYLFKLTTLLLALIAGYSVESIERAEVGSAPHVEVLVVHFPVLLLGTIGQREQCSELIK